MSQRPARSLLPQSLIRRKRDGARLDAAELRALARGIAEGQWSEGQVAAFAMAVAFRGMGVAECVAFTEALRDSGQRLSWPDLPGPVLDKHSTGGVGDGVSLLLAPLLAACGAYVPMISGRGLGHTGGTLDKLESLPGYDVNPAPERLRAVLCEVGCAIVGQSADLVPADRRLYAVRNVTATVDVPALMVASILSKKLAGGAQALVLDVKTGSGAQLPDEVQARALADLLLRVAGGTGLRARAALSDMSQVLGRNAGNALELGAALDLLCGRGGCPRLRALSLALAGELLCLGGLAADAAAQGGASVAAGRVPIATAAQGGASVAAGRVPIATAAQGGASVAAGRMPIATANAGARLERALDSGAAAERFARMVAALGGPHDLLEHSAVHLPRAPVQHAVPALQIGYVTRMDVRALGLTVVALGGGRSYPEQEVDHAVGLAEVVGRGEAVTVGQPLAIVHARTASAAEAAVRAVQAAIEIGPEAPAPVELWHWYTPAAPPA